MLTQNLITVTAQLNVTRWRHYFLTLLVKTLATLDVGEHGGSVVECRTPEREVRGSRPTAAVLYPWARHFTPRKYWLITKEAMAPSRHDWKIVDWDVKPQHNQPHLMLRSNRFQILRKWRRDVTPAYRYLRRFYIVAKNADKVDLNCEL